MSCFNYELIPYQSSVNEHSNDGFDELKVIILKAEDISTGNPIFIGRNELTLKNKGGVVEFTNYLSRKHVSIFYDAMDRKLCITRLSALNESSLNGIPMVQNCKMEIKEFDKLCLLDHFKRYTYELRIITDHIPLTMTNIEANSQITVEVPTLDIQVPQEVNNSPDVINIPEIVICNNFKAENLTNDINNYLSPTLFEDAIEVIDLASTDSIEFKSSNQNEIKFTPKVTDLTADSRHNSEGSSDYQNSSSSNPSNNHANLDAFVVFDSYNTGNASSINTPVVEKTSQESIDPATSKLIESLLQPCECAICLGTMAFSHTLPCGHALCYECISDYYSSQSSSKKCPSCKADFKLQDLHFNRAMDDMIHQILQRDKRQLTEWEARTESGKKRKVLDTSKPSIPSALSSSSLQSSNLANYMNDLHSMNPYPRFRTPNSTINISNYGRPTYFPGTHNPVGLNNSSSPREPLHNPMFDTVDVGRIVDLSQLDDFGFPSMNNSSRNNRKRGFRRR